MDDEHDWTEETVVTLLPGRHVDAVPSDGHARTG